ncbi:MAG: hypothetical protein Kow0068_11640 [Marinilabiliales bacterium]
MKLAIIEIDYHVEVLENTCRILSGSRLQVSVFTTTKIYNQVSKENYEKNIVWFVCPNKLSIKKFFIDYLDDINNNDIILFNTLASKFRFFSNLQFINPVILRVHNSNAYFRPAKSYDFKLDLFLLFKDASHIIRKTIFSLEPVYRKNFLKKVDYFCFPDDTIKEYALTENMITPDKTTPTLPLVHYSNTYKKTNPTDIVYITVPGGIDPRRKDYKELYNAFKTLSKSLDKQIELTLLGQPKGLYGKKIIKLFESIANNNLHIKYYTSRVPADEFTSVMKKTDFLILPVKIKTRYTIYKELYGYTKISGSINDLIHYGKPSILPADYPANKTISPMCLQYKGYNVLAEKINFWLKSKKYVELQQQSGEILKKYEKHSIQKLFEEIILNIINT